MVKINYVTGEKKKGGAVGRVNADDGNTKAQND